MESGSSVKFSWVIDDLKEFAYEGRSYSVMFKKPAEYKLLVKKKEVHYAQILVVINYLANITNRNFMITVTIIEKRIEKAVLVISELSVGDSIQPRELTEPANPPDCR